MLKWISADFFRRSYMCPQEVRGMKEIGSRETRDGRPSSGGGKVKSEK